jgi:hypothetical protein
MSYLICGTMETLLGRYGLKKEIATEVFLNCIKNSKLLSETLKNYLKGMSNV